MKLARRVDRVQPYLFARMNEIRKKLEDQGVDVIDMSVGDPDIPTPDHIIEALSKAARDPLNHRYPPYEGTLAFRRACALYYRQRFGVELDPVREVMTLIGSKEGLAHLIWALVDGDRYALIPDPAYPVYRSHVEFAGGKVHIMPLTEDKRYLPSLEDIPSDVARHASIMVLNYPNNPTGAVADLEFFRAAVEFCRTYDIVLCHDAAYVDICFDGFRAPSVLQAAGPSARDLVVETYSLSKPFNMTGWRIAAMVGSSSVLERALGVIKTNTDSGQFNAVQDAAAVALTENPEQHIRRNVAVYQERRDIMVAALNRAGLHCSAPSGTFYLWVRVPDGETSASFASSWLARTGILLTPGSAYGKYGEGYVRFSLTVPTGRVREAARRIQESIRSQDGSQDEICCRHLLT